MHTSFADGQTDERTDKQTFFQKVLFLLPDQEYIFMSIPILIISPISLEIGIKKQSSVVNIKKLNKTGYLNATQCRKSF